MKITLLWISLILAFSVTDVRSALRRKRSLVDLGSIVKLLTGRNPWDFVGYGNWCGLGGAGIPVDDIDRCCKVHDFCYGKASDKYCRERPPHLVRYEWTHSNGKIYCLKDQDSCRNFTCSCDRKFGYCIAYYAHTYNAMFKRRKSRFVDIIFNNFDEE